MIICILTPPVIENFPCVMVNMLADGLIVAIFSELIRLWLIYFSSWLIFSVLCVNIIVTLNCFSDSCSHVNISLRRFYIVRVWNIDNLCIVSFVRRCFLV